MSDTYERVYTQSLNEPETFWAKAAEDVHWYKSGIRSLTTHVNLSIVGSQGARTNSCYNALDLHVENGRADQTALIYDSPVTGTIKTFTYRELRDEVARFAGVLVDQGVQKGDRVIIYMPMVPESVIAMLACARIGAVHSVVFGGFAANELATRIDDAKPKLILSASCGIEMDRIIAYKPLLDSAIELAAEKPSRCIILPAAPRTGLHGRRSRSGLVGGCEGCDPSRLRASCCNRSPLYPLHFWHNGCAERRCTR